MYNKVFIAASLDGYIADARHSIDFLHTFPDPVGEDMGYDSFNRDVDALLMGRRTFETVLGFGIEWPYHKPVYVWTSSPQIVPSDLHDKVFPIGGPTGAVLDAIQARGHTILYIDGGQAIQSLLQEDRIDEMVITTIPILLGSGVPLFGQLPESLVFTCTQTRTFSNGTCQASFQRKRAG